jgi:hypothetical protein
MLNDIMVIVGRGYCRDAQEQDELIFCKELGAGYESAIAVRHDDLSRHSEHLTISIWVHMLAVDLCYYHFGLFYT